MSSEEKKTAWYIQRVIIQNLRLKITQTNLLKYFFNHFLIDIKFDWKHQWEVATVTVFIYYIENILK